MFKKTAQLANDDFPYLKSSCRRYGELTLASLELQSAPAWMGRRDVLERLRVLRGQGRRLVPSRGNSLMRGRGTWDTEESTKQAHFLDLG